MKKEQEIVRIDLTPEQKQLVQKEVGKEGDSVELTVKELEENLSATEIVAQGFDEATVRWVQRRVDLNEYKRAQAAPGLKVTSRAFGVGRRMPIAQRYVG